MINVSKKIISVITLGHYCVHFVVGASTKRHVYWAMKNCGGDGEALKRLIENVVSHYKVTYLFSIYQFELLYVESIYKHDIVFLFQ